MALVFSKYLPLFVFPLCLSLMLLTVCLFWVWKPGFRQRKRKIIALMVICLLMLWTAGSRYMADLLVSSLEGRYVSKAAAVYPRADAIVVLSGGAAGQHVGSRQVSPGRSFDRLYLGWRLYQEKKAPVMVLSGGGIGWWRKVGSLTESQMMFTLARQLGVPAKALFTEVYSRNTRENAWYSREVLRDKKTVLLVTSAFHMPRARACFEKLGMKVIACPADFRVDPYKKTTTLDFLPDAGALDDATVALREYVGMVYYKLRGWI